MQNRLCMLIVGWLVSSQLVAFADAEEAVDFSREILPLLSDRCFHCHGPDAENREADLRLDQRDAAVAQGAIVPFEPESSELLARVVSSDPDLRMPPEHAHRKPLTDAEVALLKRWIAGGAPWGNHWAFEAPKRPEVPDTNLHPIDAFVQQTLQQQNMKPAPVAMPYQQLRRVSFSLTGLPPSREQLDRFVAADQDQGYAKFVDELLASPHYGERMAMWWLDAARYSDTDGYQQDATRTNWPWRDWVVGAFNRNLSFDQFTVEQFAGDLLENATQEQKLATCFHRNHMTNGEGGRHPEESRIDYVLDRVNTMGSVWLGLTLGCSQCHAHKFDPITQEDYYSLFAFFNSIDEDGRAGGGAKPYMDYVSPFANRAIEEAQRVVDDRKTVEKQVRERAEAAFEEWLVSQLENIDTEFVGWRSLAPTAIESVEGTVLEVEPDGTVQSSGPHPRQDDYRVSFNVPLQRLTGLRLEVFPHASHTDGKLSRGASGEFILTDVKLQVRKRGASQLHDVEMSGAIASAEKKVSGRNYGNVKDTLDDDPRNGWTTETHTGHEPHTAIFALAEPLQLADDEEIVFVMLHRSTRGDANTGRFRLSATDQPGRAVRSFDPMPLEQLTRANPSTIDAVESELRGRLLDQFLTDHQEYQEAKLHLDRANRQLSTAKNGAKTLKVMVLSERESARKTHVLERGVWDQHGAEVQADMPAAIMGWPTESDRSRLGLAQWLISTDNPLTARVIVNHLWQLCFGAGLVRTPEDFGLQGELPSHPELLDWLAIELMESGWDLKHVLRLIVTSHTYRQSSRFTAELLERDPDNRWLARGARFRLPSWMIRDAALRSSGLMNTAIGGPPVMPYQPEGVWAEIFMGRFRYNPSQGPAQHRRTVYAFWRRAAAPTFLFDSAQRRVCEVRLRRTNTPLQALTLLNDLNILEASRALARTSLEQYPNQPERINAMYLSVLSRPPTDEEREIVRREADRALNYYRNSADEAREFLAFGQPERREAADLPELAAYTVVASMIYNLDEAITHE